MTESTLTTLEDEWAELRQPAADGDRTLMWLFPVLLLYVGVFLGPWAIVFATLFAMKGRMGPRRFGIVVGSCGSIWCILQGLSLYNGAFWSELELQSMRSSMNFAAGVVAYVAVRSEAMRRYKTTAWTFAISAIAMLFGFALFVLLPARVLVFAGR